MKSRPSEKLAEKKTKNTTTAESTKKPAKKSLRTAAGQETAAKKKTPTTVAARQLPPEPVEVKTEPPAPPPSEPVAPDQVVEEESSPTPTPPVFVKRDLTGPDGSIRPGWEMWIGDHCFGRADSKDLLLASFERLQSPPSSFHWREVRNRMPIRGRAKRSPAPQDTGQAADSVTDSVTDSDEALLNDLDDVEETQDVS